MALVFFVITVLFSYQKEYLIDKYIYVYLNSYFDFPICLSIHPLSVLYPPSIQKLTSIPASVSQNVTNKSCLVCVKSEKYASWVTLRPQWHRCRRGEAEVVDLILKPHGQSFRRQIRLLPSEATPRKFQTKT